MSNKVNRYSVGDFGDKRLKKTGEKLHERLIESQSVCLRRLGNGRAGEVQFGRFLSNKKVNVLELIEHVCAPTIARTENRHVLLIEDTTEINLQKHVNRVSGLGTVGVTSQ
jgi:hypothetical protein